MLLYRVLYCSRNVLSGSPDAIAAEVENILAVSRKNNARDGITGGLLYSRGCFAQILEGPSEAVEAAFERIQCDARHGDVTVLQSMPVTRRDYPQWSMAFAGTVEPSAAMDLAQAFSGRTATGDELLNLLRGVVVREHEWLTPA